VGDVVEIFEESGDWFRGSCSRKARQMGIFPKSYIHLKDPAKEDPVVAECSEVLREWLEIWKRLFVVSFECHLHVMFRMKYNFFSSTNTGT
jgi:dedicator of cytokinesis protein 3